MLPSKRFHGLEKVNKNFVISHFLSLNIFNIDEEILCTNHEKIVDYDFQ